MASLQWITQYTQQTLKRMSYTIDLTEGLANRIKAVTEDDSQELLKLVTDLRSNVKQIEEILAAGRPTVSDSEKQIGLKVQEGVQETTQI